MNDPLMPTPASVLHRATDGDTSREAARSVSMRSGSQKARLLDVYANSGVLTDDEAADRAGLLTKPGCCWWHRCSDLRKEGLIVQVNIKTSKLTGEERMGCVITERGLNIYKEMTQ
jgi:hypothetical protein